MQPDFCEDQEWSSVLYSNDPTLCISDESTPEQCLNNYIRDFSLANINYDGCFVHWTYNEHISNTHNYIIAYGGCDRDGKTLDVYYD